MKPLKSNIRCELGHLYSKDTRNGGGRDMLCLGRGLFALIGAILGKGLPASLKLEYHLLLHVP